MLLSTFSQQLSTVGDKLGNKFMKKAISKDLSLKMALTFIDFLIQQ